MAKIEGGCLEVCEATEFVAVVTSGKDGPHVVGNWGDYMRTLGIHGDLIILPVGRYRQTEENLLGDRRLKLLVASKKVQGSHLAGQGYLICGWGEVLASGAEAVAVRAKFPWARAALVVHVEEIEAQL